MVGSSKGNVLITRPIEDAQRLGDLVTSKNYKAVYAPFLNVVLHEEDIGALDGYCGLIFTSRNGVRAFCKNSPIRDLSVFTVGDATKEIALKAGFKDVRSAQGDVKALNDIILTEGGGKTYLHIRGKAVTREFEGDNITSKILYHTDMVDEISNNVASLLVEGELRYVVFFSSRTAKAFTAYVQKNNIYEGLKQTQALCLGASMVKSVSVLSWKSVEVATQPEAMNVIDLLN